VNISGCATSGTVTAAADLIYVVTSPTTLVVKTNAFCTGTANVVTLTDQAGDTVVSVPGATSGAMKLDFITPPNLVAVPTDLSAAGTLPVVSFNTAKQTPINQVAKAPTTGGTTIKVTAGTNKFAQSTTYPLAASLGGVALTGVTGYTAAGTVVTSGAVDYFTAKVGAHAAGAVGLSVTSAGITKSFSNALTNFAYSGPTISVAPAFGPTDGGNVVKITGAGFTSSTTVSFCGVNAPQLTVAPNASTATVISVTAPAFVDPALTTAAAAVDGPCSIKVTTAGVTSVVNAGSTYTYVAQG
jgi:hypothetical protein